MYIYLHDRDGSICDVLAVQRDCWHTMRFGDDTRDVVAVWSTTTTDTLVETAETQPHCVPAGAGWRLVDRRSERCWRWERVWAPVVMPGAIGEIGEEDSDG